MPYLPHLQTLKLQDNEIASLSPMHGLPSLTSLDLSFNQLATLAQLDNLSPLLELRQLRLTDNPVEHEDGYSQHVQRLLPWTEHAFVLVSV